MYNVLNESSFCIVLVGPCLDKYHLDLCCWGLLSSIEPHDVLKDHLCKQHGLSSLRQLSLLDFNTSPTGEKQALKQGQCA